MTQLDLRVTYKLNIKKRMRLVRALLKCSSFSTPRWREIVVSDLGEIGTEVKLTGAAKDDVISIVTTCENHPEGIEKLLWIVNEYEGKTKAKRELEEVELAILAPLSLELL